MQSTTMIRSSLPARCLPMTPSHVTNTLLPLNICSLMNIKTSISRRKDSFPCFHNLIQEDSSRSETTIKAFTLFGEELQSTLENSTKSIDPIRAPKSFALLNRVAVQTPFYVRLCVSLSVSTRTGSKSPTPSSRQGNKTDPRCESTMSPPTTGRLASCAQSHSAASPREVFFS